MSTAALDKFKEAYAEGVPYEEALRRARLQTSRALVEYWNVLVMEAAIAKSSVYFDKLLELSGWHRAPDHVR